MTVLPFTRDKRIELWIAGGVTRKWRVTSNNLTYGEFDEINDARALLHLLIKGDPERFKGIDR